MTERRYASKADKGWWYRATDEQRLAQIDAGIELGMTAKQVAMNCGCLWTVGENGADHLHRGGNNVAVFAFGYGRKFKGNSAGARRKRSELGKMSRAKAAMASGFVVDAAFDIFGTSSPSEAFLDDTGA